MPLLSSVCEDCAVYDYGKGISPGTGKDNNVGLLAGILHIASMFLQKLVVTSMVLLERCSDRNYLTVLTPRKGIEEITLRL